PNAAYRLDTLPDGTVPLTIRIRDQKPPETHRFACSGYPRPTRQSQPYPELGRCSLQLSSAKPAASDGSARRPPSRCTMALHQPVTAPVAAIGITRGAIVITG